MKKAPSYVIKLLIFVNFLLTFSLSLKADASPIVYYFSPPDTVDREYPCIRL